MNNQKAKKFLVTGGAGFIGSHLCQKLLEFGQVTCIDNLSTGSGKNIDHLLKNSSFYFAKIDVTEKNLTEKLPGVTFDYILHLASPAGPNPQSPKSYHKLWQETYLANSLGTHYLCQLAAHSKAVFLFASSSEIYGDPRQHPQKENYLGDVNCIGPRSIYDESKRLGEAITANYSRHLNLSTRIVRIFNTYGPKMNIDDGRALPLFIHQILQKKPVTIYGQGKQTRSFCYIDDLVNGVVKLLFCQKANNLPVNLGNPEEITIQELVTKISQIADYEPKIEYSPLPENDPLKRKPDISRARELLNWQPEVTLDQGLKKTFSYYQEVEK